MTNVGKTGLLIALIILGGVGYLIFRPTADIPNPITRPTPIVTDACFVGGCSSEVCSDQKDIVSNCIYKEEFACYQGATCERQSSGQCGWTETTELKSCIENANNSGGDRIAAGYVAGHVTIGPNCPVEQEGKPCPPPPGAYSSREVTVYDEDKTTINVKGKIDAEGNYKIALGPGTYYVQIKPAGIGEGEKKVVTIKSFETSTLDFDIDTGIR